MTQSKGRPRARRGPVASTACGIALCGAIFIVLQGCTEKMNEPDADRGTREAYYLDAGGYGFPYKVSYPASRAEALKNRVYYRAEYDGEGKLIVLEKFLDGAMEIRHEYSYHPNGVIREARLSRGDTPGVIVHTWDRARKRLSTTRTP